MKTVEPIKDPNIIKGIASYLGAQNQRDKVLFIFGIGMAIRITDILKLRVYDVRNQDYLQIIESKTKDKNNKKAISKQRKILIPSVVKKTLTIYLKDKKEYEYLFPSRQSNKPISRVRAWQILKDAGKVFGIKDIGTHTLRKTFGYHYYVSTRDISMLKYMLGHRSEEYTLRYIGMIQEHMDNDREVHNIINEIDFDL